MSIASEMLNTGRVSRDIKVAVQSEGDRVVVLTNLDSAVQFDVTSRVVEDFRTVILTIKHGGVTVASRGSMSSNLDGVVSVNVIFDNLTELSSNVQFALKSLSQFLGCSISIRLSHTYGPSFTFKA